MIMRCERGVPAPTLTFWGAAQTVTGSMHLVEVGDECLLLDCGTVCGVRRPTRPHVSFPVPPETLDAVVLSHAHIDHCGSLPALVRQGFTGPIYCTPATRELIGLLLADSARVQEEEERVACVLAGPAASSTDLPPRSAVQQVVRQCVEVPYGKPVPLTPHAE